MAETIGKIECQKKGCDQVADLCKTKRGKFYLKCPVHGVDNLGTNAAQAEIKKIIEAGKASENIGGIVIGDEPAAPEKKAPEPKPDKATDEKPDQGKEKGSTMFFIISFFIGMGAWLWKKSKRV